VDLVVVVVTVEAGEGCAETVVDQGRCGAGVVVLEVVVGALGADAGRGESQKEGAREGRAEDGLLHGS